MNLDNYKAKPIYILKQLYMDDTKRQYIVLVSDDRKAIENCCEAYNMMASKYNYRIFYSVEGTIAYYK